MPTFTLLEQQLMGHHVRRAREPGWTASLESDPFTLPPPSTNVRLGRAGTYRASCKKEYFKLDSKLVYQKPKLMVNGFAQHKSEILMPSKNHRLVPNMACGLSHI